ncbi:hypothetical protein CEXT_58911 [Caerostris extrusa]|uniref:Uncharacterized protein n=1 Tax=Caerostris extrusa TaxID=172846 RepID=A0AAV4QVR8_CAEEX|nr:hypothetical protein CEXT_58911 [Caerostris extrusa]
MPEQEILSDKIKRLALQFLIKQYANHSFSLLLVNNELQLLDKDENTLQNYNCSPEHLLTLPIVPWHDPSFMRNFPSELRKSLSSRDGSATQVILRIKAMLELRCNRREKSRKKELKRGPDGRVASARGDSNSEPSFQEDSTDDVPFRSLPIECGNFLPLFLRETIPSALYSQISSGIRTNTVFHLFFLSACMTDCELKLGVEATQFAPGCIAVALITALPEEPF